MLLVLGDAPILFVHFHFVVLSDDANFVDEVLSTLISLV